MNLNLGEKIRKRRKQMGLTLKELAGDRVTAAQISAVEKGKCKPSSALLEYISEKLEVDVDYFILTEEERYRKKFSLIKEECENLFNEKKYDAAAENVEKAKDIFQYLDDSQKGYFYYIKGKCHYTQNNYNAAFELNIQALTYYLKTKEIQTIVDIFFKIGTCLYHTEKYDMAVGYYLSAYRNANQETDKNLVAKILYNISLCYISLKKYNEAKEFIEKTYDFLNKNDFSKKESLYPGLEMMKGLIIIEQKENQEGIENFDEAFERYKKEGDIAGMGRARNNAALCLWEIGDREKAIEYINEAIEYKENSEDSI
ncbi:hypothetical protein Q428_08420 [Fervidicella metallireducens AeB]|uniref:HTH cro/C1-type domain-containing protein n=1 Tax=Fervidicella metallireducens AeB TaxID=1403537 RepID=A0A017RUF9_9CLOT|nr:helix-turn-helix transcriptional regulator [Fervidicella metallireducens]EYE88322.1 hypothetical protein Q428_08420 [Fervidicella metallireducens AeB]